MSLFTTLISSKVAAGAIAVSTLAVGGTAAAACTNTLPAPVQEIAHETVGAPAPDDSTTATTASTETESDAETASDDSKKADESTSEPTSSAATTEAAAAKVTLSDGKAAGLCTAYTADGLHNPKSHAYQSLVAAATTSGSVGADADAIIKAYCLVHVHTSTATTDPATVPSAAPKVKHHHHAVKAESDDNESTKAESDDHEGDHEQEHSSVSRRGSSHDEVSQGSESDDDQGEDRNDDENDDHGSDD